MPDPVKVYVLEQLSPDFNWEVVDVYASVEAAKAALVTPPGSSEPDLVWESADGGNWRATILDEEVFFIHEFEVKS